MDRIIIIEWEELDCLSNILDITHTHTHTGCCLKALYFTINKTITKIYLTSNRALAGKALSDCGLIKTKITPLVRLVKTTLRNMLEFQ